MKRVVDRRVRYRLAFIHHVRKEDVPGSVTTPITSVVKNRGEPSVASGVVSIRSRLCPGPRKGPHHYDDAENNKKNGENREGRECQKRARVSAAKGEEREGEGVEEAKRRETEGENGTRARVSVVAAVFVRSGWPGVRQRGGRERKRARGRPVAERGDKRRTETGLKASR